MSIRVLPAVVAAILTAGLAALLFVPFVAREYRRYGELRGGAVALRFGALLYAFGLMSYVLIPLPPVVPGFCAAFDHLQPQWEPLASLEGIRRPRSWAELSGLLADGSVRQFGYNVALFVPLGMLVRHLFRRGFPATVLIGFSTSLCVELTQLTGIWSVYPCPYRLFDVDDLIANTGGALAGALFAPLLRPVSGPDAGADADAALVPRPVTTGRRLLGMVCDLLLLWWLGLGVARLTELVFGPGMGLWRESAALWFGPSALLLLLTIAGRGSSLGQHAVRLRAVTSAGSPVTLPRTVLRWVLGLGGFAVAQGLIHGGPWPELGAPLAVAWCAAHALSVSCDRGRRHRGHRGITGRFAGLKVVDARISRDHHVWGRSQANES